MDILKLLSRSTKQTSKSAGPKIVLPSAGISANPQLYHDGVLDSRGKKRKRGTGITEEEEGHETIDFFAEKTTPPNPNKIARVTDPNPLGKLDQDDSLTSPKLLDEGECRQMLKSHRLKFTLLRGPNESQKKIKKLKKSMIVKKPMKDEFTQIFPQPLISFADLQTTYDISARLAENLVQQGYKIPTEVQMGSLPMLLHPTRALGEYAKEVRGDEEKPQVDLLVVAPTGSGKTLAFLVPVVNQIIQGRRNGKRGHGLEAIVIAPTKELASQIVNEAKKLCLRTGVKVVGMKKGLRIVPGVSLNKQDSDSNEGDDKEQDQEDGEKAGAKVQQVSLQPVAKSDILVTTPGLLLSAMAIGSSDNHAPLPTVRTLVFDEADVLLDPLFRDQTLRIWKSCTNSELRVTLWSATMGSNIEALASNTIYERRSQLAIEDNSRPVRLVVGLKDSAIPNITHRLTYAATEPGKLIALRQLLHPTATSTDAAQSLRPPFLVFTQTISRAIALHSELLYDIPAEAGGSSRIAVLHSDLSDSARDNVMTRFRNGEVWILITTDILSRGVDFRGINGVVNYDAPNSGASYIHRVGRTGRAGRNGGVAVTFYTKEDIPYVKNIANIIAASEKQAGKLASEASMQKWFLDTLPKPSKDEKKKLKLHGVEARRGGWKDVKARVQISTKSGYERRIKHNRKGAIQGSKRRAQNEENGSGEGKAVEVEAEWSGIDE
jgi:ATP-dependent RNA helicase DDX52/ROK1